MKNNYPLLNAVGFLPLKIGNEILKVLKNGADKEEISDIRLRANGISYISSGKKSFPLDTELTFSEIGDIVYTLSEGSVYSNADTIREGFVNFRGFRCGIVGRAVSHGEKVDNVYEYSSVSIRIPHDIPNCADGIYRLFSEGDPGGGIIVYSPPATGKTTLLRDLIRLFSKDGRQFSVVDSRGELCSACQMTSADVLLYYPKSVGIEAAVRSMSPEVIICDEISGERDAEAALYANSAGVPLIASAHASSFSDLRMRRGNEKLFDLGTFRSAVGIKRSEKYGVFTLDITELK